MLRNLGLVAVLACSTGLIGIGCGGTRKDAGDASRSRQVWAPSAKGDIIDVVTGPEMQQMTTLVAALEAADLTGTLKGPGPFTVLAPTNDAFAKLPPGTLEDLLKPQNKEKLRKILLFHVIKGRHDAAEVRQLTSAKTIEGDAISIKRADGKVMIGNDKAMAAVIKTDVPATNGVIHWIDTVLMP